MYSGLTPIVNGFLENVQVHGVIVVVVVTLSLWLTSAIGRCVVVVVVVATRSLVVGRWSRGWGRLLGGRWRVFRSFLGCGEVVGTVNV